MSEAAPRAMSGGRGGVRVRAAREADLEAVLRIEADSFANPWTFEHFADCVRREDAAVLVAVAGPRGPGGADEVVAGSVAVAWAGAEAEVASLAVAREHRGRGVGRALLAEVVRLAAVRRMRRLCLAVRASNAAAVRLYAGMGFAEIGVHPGYYRRPAEDARVFLLELDADPAVPGRPPGPARSSSRPAPDG